MCRDLQSSYSYSVVNINIQRMYLHLRTDEPVAILAFCSPWTSASKSIWYTTTVHADHGIWPFLQSWSASDDAPASALT